MAPPTSDVPYSRVRVLFADQLNLARGKYIPASFATRGAARLCVGTFAVTYSKNLVAVPGGGLLEGLPDMEMVFDPNDLRASWEPNTEIALADLEFEGAPFALSGRGALHSAISAWRAVGLEPMIGFEGEGYIFQRDGDGNWVPYDTPGAYVYGTGPFTDPAGLVDLLWETAHRCNLPIESINSEFDAPQFELTLGYADALKACDDFFLFRTMAREVLYRHGYLLSFMPQPLPGISGSGLHANLSFRTDEGKNALDGGTLPGSLSDLARGCIAGLLTHHESLGALLAPTVNSYDRLKPGGLSGYWANWGFDHRGVAVRLSSEQGAAARIEHRVADCAASPYVVAASVLQAARLGLTQEYTLGPAEDGDGLERTNTDRHISNSLAESLDRLEQDEALGDAVGRLLVDNFLAIKRAEIEEVASLDADGLFDYYAPFI